PRLFLLSTRVIHSSYPPLRAPTKKKKNHGWRRRIRGQATGGLPLSPPAPLSPAANRASASAPSPPRSRCSSPSLSTRPSLVMAVRSGGGARCGAGRSCGGRRRGHGAAAAGGGSGAVAVRSGRGGVAGSGNGGRHGWCILLFSKNTGDRLISALSLVVYMEKPSSGLDPTSRRALWHAVLSAKQNKAIVFTTHSMEEAEALCVASAASIGSNDG
ncbi:unnamed protein product, partial [Urochloa humidicola]